MGREVTSRGEPAAVVCRALEAVGIEDMVVDAVVQMLKDMKGVQEGSLFDSDT